MRQLYAGCDLHGNNLIGIVDGGTHPWECDKRVNDIAIKVLLAYNGCQGGHKKWMFLLPLAKEAA